MHKFYLGTHQPHWLATAGVPLFVSHRRLAVRKSLPKAIEGWALESGGFSELSLYGEWRTTPEVYVAAVRRYDEKIGMLEWAAPQDWMCEPPMLDKTRRLEAERDAMLVGGGIVPEDELDAMLGELHLVTFDEQILLHQERTVANFVRLQELWYAETNDESPFMPVLQGWEVHDYLRCVRMYRDAGVELTDFPVVGLGSVCRRQDTDEIGEIVETLLHAVPGLELHGFGVKMRGLEKYGLMLLTADSLAWSFDARHRDPLGDCVGHKNCANCLPFALQWRDRLMSVTAEGESA